MTFGLFSCYSPRTLAYRVSKCTTHASPADEHGGRIGGILPAKLDKFTKVLICGEFRRRTSHQYPADPVSWPYGCNATRNQSAEGGGDEAGSSTENDRENNIEQSEKSHLDLLRQITANSESSSSGKTISEQLRENFALAGDEEFTTPLGSGQLEMEPLTISQKRNIRRQDYLNQVSRRNDTRFFTTVALFLLLPPAVILGVAVAIGYVDFNP